MSKRKEACQGSRPAKLTVVNRGLDLFSQPPTDDSTFGIEPHKYYTNNDSVTPVEFTLKKPDRWTKQKESYIYFFAGLPKAGGADDKVGMVQNMAFSTFSHIKIKINRRQVNMPTPKSFAMVQWLRAFLNMSNDAKKAPTLAVISTLPIETFSPSLTTEAVPRATWGTNPSTCLWDKFRLATRTSSSRLKWKSTFDSTLSTATGPSSVTVLTTTGWWSKPHPSPTSSPIICWSIPSTHFPWNTPWHRPVPLAATPCKTSRFETSTFPADSECIATATWCPRDPFPSESFWRKLNPFTFPLCKLTKLETKGSGGFDEIDLKEEPSEPYRRFIQQFQQTGTGIRLTAPQFYAKYNLYIFDFTPSTDPMDPTL